MMTESQAVAVFGALAQETRLQIVRTLVKAGPAGLTAGKLAQTVGVSPSNLSFHLRELLQAGLVSSRRQQRSVIYVCVYETIHLLQAYLLERCCSGISERSPAKAAERKKK